MGEAHYHRLPMDGRHRVALSKLLKKNEHVSSFRAYREGGRIILEPMIEIPAHEVWVYDNPKALKALKEGIAQKGRHDLGSFARYADDDL